MIPIQWGDVCLAVIPRLCDALQELRVPDSQSLGFVQRCGCLFLDPVLDVLGDRGFGKGRDGARGSVGQKPPAPDRPVVIGRDAVQLCANFFEYLAWVLAQRLEHAMIIQVFSRHCFRQTRQPLGRLAASRNIPNPRPTF